MISSVSRKYPVITQIIKYGVIGCVSAALDSAVFIVLNHFGVWVYLSNFISVNCGITLSFYLNSHYNFKKTDMLLRRGARFFSIGYCGLLISTFLLWFGITVLNYGNVRVKFASVIIVAFIQFILNKLITFK